VLIAQAIQRCHIAARARRICGRPVGPVYYGSTVKNKFRDRSLQP
jgi:hypothetical protein